MIARLSSAVVLIGILVVALIEGGIPLIIIATMAVAIALYEYTTLATKARLRPIPIVIYLLGIAFTWSLVGYDLGPRLFVIAALALTLGLPLCVVAGSGGLMRWGASVAGAFYIGLPMGMLLSIASWHTASDPHIGRWMIVVILAGVIACDTAAFFVGSAMGRHRFFHDISPRKSVEGAVAGFVAATIVTAILAGVLTHEPFLFDVALGAAIGITAQAGDLAESSLKRAAKEKDASHLIPGHGGMLDRLDSLLCVAPCAFVFVVGSLGWHLP